MNVVCGLDLHKDSIFACVMKENGEKTVQEYGTLTPELERLRDWLVEESVEAVAMESTSVYWKPVWRILSSDFHMVLVNPYFIKQLPGRKTDVKDAEWIATTLIKDLLKESFVPDEIQSSLRKYERMLFRLNRLIVQEESLLDNELQECNIRLSNYVSDVGGKSYRKVVRLIIEGGIPCRGIGQRDTQEDSQQARGGCVDRGTVRFHHRGEPSGYPYGFREDSVVGETKGGMSHEDERDKRTALRQTKGKVTDHSRYQQPKCRPDIGRGRM